jgi:hypothetical protein
MWAAGRGSYNQIDQDFAAGMLDTEWKAFCKEFADGSTSAAHSGATTKP